MKKTPITVQAAISVARQKSGIIGPNQNISFIGISPRVFAIVENHLIHHRGQTLVYLRLNNIVPKGYFAW